MIPKEDYRNGYTKGAEIAVSIIIMIFFVLCFGIGCMTPQKAVNYLKDKDLLDDTCAANFPVQEKFIKGDSVVTTDTLLGIDYQTDTLVTKDTVYIKRVEPGKTITRTIRTTDTVVKRDAAYENVQNDKIKSLETELAKEKTLKEKYQNDYNALKEKWSGKIGIPWWWFLVLGALIGLSARFKILRFFNPFK